MNLSSPYLPRHINQGAWLTAYSLGELERRIDDQRVVLPICSLGTPANLLQELAPLVLPPLYHEAMDTDLKRSILQRIDQCFPYYQGTRKRQQCRRRLEVVELPAEFHSPPSPPRVLAFSVDTAVEEHGPHLPLATDTIQSYAVLHQLADEFSEFHVGPPVDYGHLTWGLPFGMSIDLTPPLLTRYVTAFVDAVMDWMSPGAIYVVDVHGSPVHRGAIQAGLAQSCCKRYRFRWLHEPLVEFAGERGDQHAGGVETALICWINNDLVDSNFWPQRLDDLVAGQMDLETALRLSSDLSGFIDYAQQHSLNGIIGNVRNYFDVDAETMMQRMLDAARDDLQRLQDEE